MQSDGRNSDGNGRRHACVLGASIAGLLAARALAGHFDRVTVVERDPLTTDGHRDGVPQGRHIHALMHGGSRAMDELFPGLLDQMAALGVPRSRWLERSRWYLGGTPMAPPRHTRLELATPSRPLLEKLLRTRLAEDRRVTLRTGLTVTGLTREARRITGVTLRDARGGEGLAADLVVDTTGRSSRTADWLAELGFERPAESHVVVDLGYCSRHYRRSPGELGGDLALTASTVPGLPGGAVLALEDDVWHVTLSGTLGRRAPTDPPGYEAYAAGLPISDVVDLVRGAEPLDDPVQHRVRDSVRRRWEDVADPPDGLIVMGDAVASFNPIYAQGMTVAAQEARELDRLLRTTRGPVRPAPFQRRIARLVDGAWAMSTSIDLRSPAVEGERTRTGTAFGRWVKQVQLATPVSPHVTGRLLEVINLTAHPGALLAPSVVGRVAVATAMRSVAARRADRRAVPPTAQQAPDTPEVPERSASGAVGELVVTERRVEADGVVSLLLARPRGGLLPEWTAGAHVDVHVGAGEVRQYSLCGIPGTSDAWRIAVQREMAGRGGSAFLHDDVVEGTRLTIGELRNNFPLTDAAHTLLVAGGIGITPLLAMTAELDAAGRPWTLHYGGRSLDTMAFAKDLADDPRCTLHPQDGVGLLPLAAILDAQPSGTVAFCCGPAGLLDAIEGLCADRAGLTVRMERFHPRPVPPEEEAAATEPVRRCEVRLARSGITFSVETGQPLVDELRATGVAIPFSCREGICASCETTVLHGEVSHRDSVLSPEEREAGTTMMPCVSTVRSDHLVLDL